MWIFLTQQARVVKLSVLIGIAFSCQSVMAQSVSISPLVTIDRLAGAQNKTTVMVSNNSDKPLRARIITTDFTYDRETGFIAIPTHPKSAVPYLQFSPREFVVPPGVSRTVRVGFTMPPSLPDGEYSAALYIEGLQEQQISQTIDGQKSTTVLKPRIASIFFINKGEVNSQLSIASAQWNNQSKEPVVILSNQGKTSAYPNLNWQISKGGNQVAEGKLEGIVLVAGKERAMPIKTAELTPGSYLLSGEIVSHSGGIPVKFETQLIIPDR
jgi:hypothetical protein